jgi:hypothetical protein
VPRFRVGVEVVTVMVYEVELDAAPTDDRDVDWLEATRDLDPVGDVDGGHARVRYVEEIGGRGRRRMKR